MKLLGVRIDPLTRAQARVRLDERQIIFTPNPEIILEAQKNPAFRHALGQGTLMLADGHGLLLGITLLRIHNRFLRILAFFPLVFIFIFWKAPFRRSIPEVIHGSDFMDDVVKHAAHQGWPVFFLGAGPGVAEATARSFSKRYPTLKVAGFSSADPNEAAAKEVRDSKAEVLLVAYGAPKQELWLTEFLPSLPHVRLSMAVGGSFDFYSGKIHRAPSFLRRLGLEWLWRLCLNPRQRMRRIWRAVMVFSIVSLFAFSPSLPPFEQKAPQNR